MIELNRYQRKRVASESEPRYEYIAVGPAQWMGDGTSRTVRNLFELAEQMDAAYRQLRHIRLRQLLDLVPGFTVDLADLINEYAAPPVVSVKP